VPSLLPGGAFAGGKVVMVAAGNMHTMVVTSKGVLWARGNNLNGQLGIVGLEQFHIQPALVEAEDVIGGSPMRMVACGDNHTLVVTEQGALWTCDKGENSALSHNDINNRPGGGCRREWKCRLCQSQDPSRLCCRWTFSFSCSHKHS